MCLLTCENGSSEGSPESQRGPSDVGMGRPLSMNWNYFSSPATGLQQSITVIGRVLGPDLDRRQQAGAHPPVDRLIGDSELSCCPLQIHPGPSPSTRPDALGR